MIQDYDSCLCHPSPERVFAEIRCTYWILQGREAVRRYQHTCKECHRWKSRPVVPKMADLPAAHLRLFKLAFHSTGVDCFGPFQVKVPLYTRVGTQSQTEEVHRTVLIEVEGVLNSKPLGYVPSSITDLDPVTPNLLLIGRPDGCLPQVMYPELLNRRRWKHSQILTDHFWSSFIRHYLPSLQACQKWHATRADLTKDKVVMLVDPQLPRALWSIGRVIKVHPSADGHVRSADAKIKDWIYTCPVA
ncbi:hypothetical protein AAFF_G00393890 [Aldrovandia affinis]|uniref:DUF5641 domain-containing protein n=1 Tax=Aldrovandia affinis TaxID=143900 RepID=A0AAD7WL22_9TELE|nr:hypothetical protein AAFF_G00393890 [Aldrovandia affinis]